MNIKHLLPILFLVCFGHSFAQKHEFDRNDFDEELLNTLVLKEFNKLRKKAKTVPFNLNTDLKSAAEDQRDYNLSSTTITTIQKRNKEKKRPKNRVDFYQGNFKHVVELIGYIELSETKVETYESIAKSLVANLCRKRFNSKTITDKDYENTYSAYIITADNRIISNHLVASREYDKTYSEQPDTNYYDNYSGKEGRFIFKPRNPGVVYLGPDSCIYYEVNTSLFTKLFLTNRWRSGVAADIVLKSQYPCDSTDFFNPEIAIRGIGLPPVYKKDFERFGIFGGTVNLGKMPAYIDEEFAINLTVVRKNRSWVNFIYDFVPASYYFKPKVEFEFDSLSLETRKSLVDRQEIQLTYSQSAIQPTDSSYQHLTSALSTKNKVVRIELTAFASIERPFDANTKLYSTRAKNLIQTLQRTGIDTAIIHYKFTENFSDFRKDIRYTKYSWLDTLSEFQIRSYVNSHQKDFEFLLKDERYMKLVIETQKDSTITYTKERWKQELDLALLKKNKSGISKSFEYAYSLYLDGEITIEEIQAIDVPVDDKYTRVLEDKAILEYLCASNKDSALVTLLVDLNRLNRKKSHTLATNIAIAEYLIFIQGSGKRRSVRIFFKRIEKDHEIATEVKSRILLHLASIHDENISQLAPKRFFKYPSVKHYVNSARLSTDELYQLSTYYYYFHDTRFAYNLIKHKAAKTEDPEKIIFFLKLMEYGGCDFHVSHSEKIIQYKKLAKKRPELFCAAFNYYGINLQVLDDPDVKKVYCKTCSE